MKSLTYVTEDGDILFTPDGCDEDVGYTITQLAEMGEYKYLELIAERLANREQYCEMIEKVKLSIDKHNRT